MNLPSVPLVVLDTETTGFVPKVHRVIEYASVRTQDGEIVDTYEVLISVPDEIPPHIATLTRIYQEDIEGKPSFDDLREEITSHIGEDTIVVGQNVAFDIRMLKGEGIDLTERLWIDTSMIASLVFPEFESYSLGYMSKKLQLDHAPVHRALGDVNATLELLGKCWERLLELDAESYTQLMSIMQYAPEGYKKLFQSLPEPTATTKPDWLQMPEQPIVTQELEPFTLLPKPVGTVQLVEEPIEPDFVARLIHGLDQDHTNIVAVKNLHMTKKHLANVDELTIVEPSSHLLDSSAKDQLLAQDQYTADEATLAVKLLWYKPETYNNLPIHGGEKDLWFGRLACTDYSQVYAEQFATTKKTLLLNHWQLLRMISKDDHPGASVLANNDVHIVIDDASMLEDTASKSYSWSCKIDELRAGISDKPELEKFVDLLQLWIERVREGKDVFYLTLANLQAPDATSLRTLASEILESDTLSKTDAVEPRLRDLEKMLDPENVKGRIVWIELMGNFGQTIQSVPEHLHELLEKWLYNKYATSLLIPPHNADTLSEVLPRGISTSIVNDTEKSFLQLSFESDETLDAFIEQPLPGKTIALASSRKRIEDIYVKYAVSSEKENVNLFCQGLSGGMGRMQAEFSAAEGTTIMVMTPWQFEGLSLPHPQIDHLIIDSLPFDHPNHTVLSIRAKHYRSAFMEYSLPRLIHRLYRIVRTFRQFCTEDSDVIFLDNRIESKEYGKIIWKFLKSLARVELEGDTRKPSSTSEGEVQDFPENWQMNLF